MSQDPIWEDAKKWFNDLSQFNKNQMIIVMYKMCLETSNTTQEKLIQSINQQWNEKVSKQTDVIKKLSIENEVLSSIQGRNTDTIINKLKDLESNLNNSVNGLSLKITPSLNGKIGEEHIDQILGKIPNSELYNITQDKGNGDFLFVTSGIKIMIESKNWTNSSIKGNPKEIENFKKTAIDAKENENGIDFAIMALHRVTDIKGKAMELETIFTKKGSLLLIYITNLFNHPERILYAIDCGILLLKQNSQNTINKDKFVYQINTFLKGIGNIQNSIKERQKIVKDSVQIIKKDIEQVTNLKDLLDSIINNTEEVPMKDKIINFYNELYKVHGNKTTKQMLETKCLENNIPARNIRSLGGIKEIKKLANSLIDINEEINEEINDTSSNDS
jgi:hypothetical protein